MATVINAGDVQLAATSPRLITVNLPGNVEVPAVKSIKLTATNTVFKVSVAGTSNISSITITANLIQLSGTVSFTVLSGSSQLNVVGNNCTVNYSGMLTDSITVQATLTVGGVTYSDVIDIVKVFDGAAGVNGLNIVLSNDSHVIPTDSAGQNGVYAGATSTVSVYQGSTDDSANWAFSATGSNTTFTFVNRVITVTNLSADTGYVEVLATRSGYPNLSVRFTLSKARGGVTGQDATAYWIVSNAAAIQKTIAGVYTPATIVFSAYSATGTTAPALYAGRFIIATSTDGSTYTTQTQSSLDESSISYTVPANIKTVRASLYLAGATSTLVDQEVVPVVSDGATGASAKLIALSASSQIFRIAQNGTASPASITFTATAQNLIGTPAFTVTAGTATLTGTGNTRDLTAANLSTDTATIQVSQDGVSDVITVGKVREGTSGIFALLSNSAHTLPASATGVVSSYAGSGTNINVYEGSTALTFVTSLSAASQFTVGTPTTSGTITVGARSGATTTTAIVANHSAMADGTDNLTITYPLTIRRANNETLTISLVQSISKSKVGATGNTGATGTRGSISAAIGGQTVWSDTVANNYFTTNYGGVRVLNDVITQYGTNFSETRFWNGTAWIVATAYINGNLLVDGTLGAAKIQSASITATQLAANAVTADKILANAVTSNKIQANAITAAKIAAGTITATQIATGTITASQIASGTITASQIASGTITATQIAAGTITTDRMTANTINGDRITANTLAAAKIVAGSITAAQIGAGQVTADKVNGQNLVVYSGNYNGSHAWPAAGVGGGFNLSASGLLLGNNNNTAGGYAQINSTGFFSIGKAGGNYIEFNPNTGEWYGNQVVNTNLINLGAVSYFISNSSGGQFCNISIPITGTARSVSVIALMGAEKRSGLTYQDFGKGGGAFYTVYRLYPATGYVYSGITGTSTTGVVGSVGLSYSNVTAGTYNIVLDRDKDYTDAPGTWVNWSGIAAVVAMITLR
jgi:hypothetical protein